MRKVRSWLLVVAAALVGATALSTPALAAPAATPHAIVTKTGIYGHTCKALGNDRRYQGVVCSEILVANLTDGSTRVYGEAEVVCETLKGSAPVQCANGTVWFGYVWTDGGHADLEHCGHSFGPCDTPRELFVSAEPLVVPNGFCVEVHGRIWWLLGNGPTTTIELPKSAKNVSMATGTTLDTKWFLVGNGC
jgi:hypothetical protein